MTIDPQHLLVLGAGTGLGAAVARRFGREGFRATLLGRSEPDLADLAASLRSAGTSVTTVAADAADAPGFRKVLQGLATRDAPGVVVYNAALITVDSILTADLDHLLSAYAVDVLGAISAAQVFTPAMRAAGAGTLLVTAGDPAAAYGTLALGKAALRTAVGLVHDELKTDGVHATSIVIAGAIAPGGPFDPDRIADVYWALHSQPVAEWAAETRIDGRRTASS